MGTKRIKKEGMLKKVSSAVRTHNMIRRGDTVVVAVSGGPDSVCLLDVLAGIAADLGAFLVIAHYNHRLRPGEDEAESEFIRGLSVRYGLPLESGEWLGGPVAGMGSREDQARKARYAFLFDVLRRLQGASVAVGHNLNDQAETLLIRLLRGSGPQGLSAMRPAGPGPVIRPLLEVSRREIISYLTENSLAYMIDSSNNSTNYLRNRIRLELIPSLEKIQPAAVSVLSRVASIMREDEECLSSQAENLFTAAAIPRGKNALSLSLRDLSSVHPALVKRVFRRAVEGIKGDLMAVGAVHLEALMSLLKGRDPSAQLHLPGGLRVRREYEGLLFEKDRGDAAHLTPMTIEGPGAYPWEAGLIMVEEIAAGGSTLSYSSRHEAYLDADKVAYPITVRGVVPGDRFIPMGMSRPKKLKKFFIDCKVPLEKRKGVPLFLSEGRILWVGGMRVDERFRATGDTKRILKISLSFPTAPDPDRAGVTA